MPLKIFIVIVLLSFGMLLYAASVKEITNIFIDQIINPLIAVLFGIAAVVFLWGVIEFIAKSGSEEARTTGKKHMAWGLVGLVIMSGVFGIINILINFFKGLK